MAKALEDIKILDFTQALAGPYCTYLLGSLGAKVIKVERAGEGDFIRGVPPFTDKMESPHFIARNRCKKSITLNLASARGQQIARELAKMADVAVENFSPGVMDRLGLGYEDLRQVNPKLIYASVSGYGHTGPRTLDAAFDVVAQAMGGLMDITGFPDGPPTKTGPSTADLLGGLNLTIAILAALHFRSISGLGQMIDISMQDCVFAHSLVELAGSYLLKHENPKRNGNAHPIGAPFGTYPAKDGHAVICVSTPNQWNNFLRAIGREDLVGNQRYATQAARAQNRAEVIAFVEEWTKARTVEEVVTTLTKAHLPSSPVPSFDEVAHDPQLLSRAMIVEVEQAVSGKLRMPGSVYKMSQTPGDATMPAPSPGEHNHEVYAGMLGYSESEIKKLAADGIT